MSEIQHAIVCAILDLCEARGLKALEELPGIVHIRVDDNWDIWTNPHNEPLLKDGTAIKPYHFLIEWNDWPTAYFHPLQDKILFAAGKVVNIETFIAAVQKATEEARHE